MGVNCPIRGQDLEGAPAQTSGLKSLKHPGHFSRRSGHLLHEVRSVCVERATDAAAAALEHLPCARPDAAPGALVFFSCPIGEVPPHLRTLHVSHEPYLLDMPLTDNLVSARLPSFPLPRGAKR